MFDEPLRHRLFMVALALCAVATSPFPFVGQPLRWWAGLPIWLWWSMGFTVLLSALTFYAIIKLWKDDTDD